MLCPGICLLQGLQASPTPPLPWWTGALWQACKAHCPRAGTASSLQAAIRLSSTISLCSHGQWLTRRIQQLPQCSNTGLISPCNLKWADAPLGIGSLLSWPGPDVAVGAQGPSWPRRGPSTIDVRGCGGSHHTYFQATKAFLWDWQLCRPGSKFLALLTAGFCSMVAHKATRTGTHFWSSI